METPPPFSPPPFAPPPPQKGKSGWIVGLVIAVIIFCCGGPILLIGGGTLWGLNKFGPFVTCAISASETRKAILAYEKAKGHFPPAATWQSDIAPFYKEVLASKKGKNDTGPFKVWNMDETLVCTNNPSPTGMAYNEDLAGKKLSDIKDPNTTYVLFEVAETGLNLHQKYTRRPSSSYPKMLDKPRPWLELPLAGDMTGGDSNSFKFSAGDDEDSKDTTSKDEDEDTTPSATPKDKSKAKSDTSDSDKV